MIFPVKRGLIEEIEPKFCPMDSDTEVNLAYRGWAESRRAFNEALRMPSSEAQVEKWQKDYFKGGARFGASPPDHRTKLRPKPFVPSD